MCAIKIRFLCAYDGFFPTLIGDGIGSEAGDGALDDPTSRQHQIAVSERLI
jgi:hypothetical protein